MSEPDVFPEEDVSDWFRHPGTIAKAKFWMEKRHQLHQALMRACSSSTDPQVRGSYQEFLAAEATVATLTPQKKEVNGKR